MANYGKLWESMVNYGKLWQTMVDHGKLWQTMVNYGKMWRFPEMEVPQNGWFIMDDPIKNG